MQATLNLWLSKTQNLFSEVTTPLVKNVHDLTPHRGTVVDTPDMEDDFMPEQTIDSRTLKGVLSSAAIASIEQFGR